MIFILSWFVIGFLGAVLLEHDHQTGNRLLDQPVKWNWKRVLLHSFFGYILLVPSAVIYLGGMHLAELDAIERKRQNKEVMNEIIEKIRKDNEQRKIENN